jgi:hypothetical protein
MKNDVLADVRSKARSDFFGYNEPGTIKYMGDAGEINGRERRFSGWFGFTFKMPERKHPCELAAEALLTGGELTQALKSVQGTRFVMAIVTMVKPGKGVYLELENEEFEVDSRLLGQNLYKDDALCAHLIPISRGRWLVGPGWVVWPARLGSGIRSRLKNFQLDSIQLERFLQMRTSDDEKPKAKPPSDSNLKEAVVRMTAAAKAAGKEKLIKSEGEWTALVLTDMHSPDINKFSQRVMEWVGNTSSLDDLNNWLALALNIWNNTPQPEKGNRTANELFVEEMKWYGERGR